MLEQVRDLIGERRLEEAIRLADRLIDRSPKFAEAYNQRAIAEFIRGRFDASAADCRRVLEYNPYHIGALGGLAQCEIRLNRRGDALKTLRRSQKLQPHSEGIREMIALLESDVRLTSSGPCSAAVAVPFDPHLSRFARRQPVRVSASA